MVKCYLLPAPVKKQNSIFKNKEWGLKNKNMEVWKKLQGNYAVILGWDRKLSDFVVIGLCKVKRTFIDHTPKPEWGDKPNQKSQYPLRMNFSHIVRLNPIPARPLFKNLPNKSFSIIEDKLPLELEKHLQGILDNRDVFELLTSILEANLFEELNNEIVAFVPPVLLKPIVSETSSEEFEDLCSAVLRLFGLKVYQLGYKNPYKEIWDLEIKHGRKPIIVDVKSSRSYYLRADEKRKLKDYAAKKKEVDMEPVDVFLIALDFKKNTKDELKELKDELERKGIGWFFAIRYFDLLKLIPKQIKGELEDPLKEIRNLSVI